MNTLRFLIRNTIDLLLMIAVLKLVFNVLVHKRLGGNPHKKYMKMQNPRVYYKYKAYKVARRKKKMKKALKWTLKNIKLATLYVKEKRMAYSGVQSEQQTTNTKPSNREQNKPRVSKPRISKPMIPTNSNPMDWSEVMYYPVDDMS